MFYIPLVYIKGALNYLWLFRYTCHMHDISNIFRWVATFYKMCLHMQVYPSQNMYPTFLGTPAKGYVQHLWIYYLHVMKFIPLWF